MKVGRVITGDELQARAEADRLLSDAKALAAQLVRDARNEAERISAEAGHARAATVTGPGVAEGQVEGVTGLVIRAMVPGVALGELVRVDRRGAGPLLAEVVGFRGEQATLLALGELGGVAPAAAVWRTGA